MLLFLGVLIFVCPPIQAWKRRRGQEVSHPLQLPGVPVQRLQQLKVNAGGLLVEGAWVVFFIPSLGAERWWLAVAWLFGQGSSLW